MEKMVRNLAFSMLFGSLMSVFFAPFVLVTMLMDLNASVMQIALVPLAAQCGGALGLPVALLVAGMEPRRAVLGLLFAARAMLVALPLALLFHSGLGAALPWMVLLVFGCSSALSSSAAGAVNSWFKAVLPVGAQGTLLGRRNALGGVVVGLLTPLLGLLLAWRPGAGGQAFYAALLLAALGFGFVDLWFLGKVQGVAARGRVVSFADIKAALGKAELWKPSLLPALVNGAGLWIAPFGLLLLYDLGLGSWGVGLATALGTLGGAAGLLLGGHLADRAYVRRIFLHAAEAMAALAGLLLLLSMGWVGRGAAAWGAALALAALAFVQGMVASAQVKYVFEMVKDGSNLSFSLVAFWQNLAAMAVLGLSARLGACFSGWTGAWPGFSYFQPVLACALAVGAVAALALRRLELHHVPAEPPADCLYGRLAGRRG